MKVPYSWLKEYVDIDISAEELEEKLQNILFSAEIRREYAEKQRNLAKKNHTAEGNTAVLRKVLEQAAKA